MPTFNQYYYEEDPLYQDQSMGQAAYDPAVVYQEPVPPPTGGGEVYGGAGNYGNYTAAAPEPVPAPVSMPDGSTYAPTEPGMYEQPYTAPGQYASQAPATTPEAAPYTPPGAAEAPSTYKSAYPIGSTVGGPIPYRDAETAAQRSNTDPFGTQARDAQVSQDVQTIGNAIRFPQNAGGYGFGASVDETRFAAGEAAREGDIRRKADAANLPLHLQPGGLEPAMRDDPLAFVPGGGGINTVDDATRAMMMARRSGGISGVLGNAKSAVDDSARWIRGAASATDNVPVPGINQSSRIATPLSAGRVGPPPIGATITKDNLPGILPVQKSSPWMGAQADTAKGPVRSPESLFPWEQGPRAVITEGAIPGTAIQPTDAVSPTAVQTRLMAQKKAYGSPGYEAGPTIRAPAVGTPPGSLVSGGSSIPRNPPPTALQSPRGAAWGSPMQRGGASSMPKGGAKALSQTLPGEANVMGGVGPRSYGPSSILHGPMPDALNARGGMGLSQYGPRLGDTFPGPFPQELQALYGPRLGELQALHGPPIPLPQHATVQYGLKGAIGAGRNPAAASAAPPGSAIGSLARIPQQKFSKKPLLAAGAAAAVATAAKTDQFKNVTIGGEPTEKPSGPNITGDLPPVKGEPRQPAQQGQDPMWRFAVPRSGAPNVPGAVRGTMRSEPRPGVGSSDADLLMTKNGPMGGLDKDGNLVFNEQTIKDMKKDGFMDEAGNWTSLAIDMGAVRPEMVGTPAAPTDMEYGWRENVARYMKSNGAKSGTTTEGLSDQPLPTTPVDLAAAQPSAATNTGGNSSSGFVRRSSGSRSSGGGWGYQGGGGGYSSRGSSARFSMDSGGGFGGGGDFGDMESEDLNDYLRDFDGNGSIDAKDRARAMKMLAQAKSRNKGKKGKGVKLPNGMPVNAPGMSIDFSGMQEGFGNMRAAFEAAKKKQGKK
jgi:hypothetical protein